MKSMLEEISAAARERRQQESGRRGGGREGRRSQTMKATGEGKARGSWYAGTETSDARVGG